jgi:histidine decarboxylase
MRTQDQEMLERRVEAEVRISHFLAEQVKNSSTYFGYPEVPENHDLSSLGISSVAKLHLNNAGDPWEQGNAKMHTKDFEREVLEQIAKLYGIEEDFWGYITSGGTEGNLYGLYMSREYFSRKQQPCVFLYSAASHYSIPKNAHLLGVNAHEIRQQASGEMDYAHLQEVLGSIDGLNETGIIINLNIGTTMKGAIDNIKEVKAQLAAFDIPQEQVLMHADAALMGLIYPFLEESEDLFAAGVTSLALSGHKFLGAIHPCGIVITRKKLHEASFGEQWVSYVGSQDTTISGSRNGFLALNLWYLLHVKGIEGYQKEALLCIENAKYLEKRLNEIDYPKVNVFPNQTIVTFQKPSQAIVSKYQLATEGNLAHIVVMQHITRSRIDNFIEDLRASIRN